MQKPPIVTYELLVYLGACAREAFLFKERFPRGVELSDEGVEVFSTLSQGNHYYWSLDFFINNLLGVRLTDNEDRRWWRNTHEEDKQWLLDVYSAHKEAIHDSVREATLRMERGEPHVSRD